MKFVAIDVETTGLGWKDSLLSVAASRRNDAGDMEGKVWLINAADLFHAPVPLPQVRYELMQWVNPADAVVMHNATFDLGYLFQSGILVPDDVRGKLLDTMLTARMTGGRPSVSLKNLAISYGLSNPKWEDQKRLRTDMINVPIELLLEYNVEDTTITTLLAEKLWKEAEAIYGRDFVLRESDFCRLMAEIKCRGKALDEQRIGEMRRMMTEDLSRLYEDFLFPAKIEGANDRNGIIRWLVDSGVGSLPKTDKGNPTVDETVLLNIADRSPHPIKDMINAILEARHLTKAVSTWIDGLWDESDGEGRVHPNYTVAGTVSYRLTCSHPNLQAVPKDMDVWKSYVSADYSQAELRLAAMYAAENNMAAQFDLGTDFHAATADLMFGQSTDENRALAKRCNFASIYGAGVTKLAESAGVSIEKAGRLRNQHRKIFPGLVRMGKKAENVWTTNGYITLLTGKRLYATPEDLQYRPYKAFNQLIQGGVAEIIKEAMFNLERSGYKIINQVHDSLEFEPPVDMGEIKRTMRGVIPEKIKCRTEPIIEMAVDLDIIREEIDDRPF